MTEKVVEKLRQANENEFFLVLLLYFYFFPFKSTLKEGEIQMNIKSM